MLVVPAVRDGQTDFVNACRPTENPVGFAVQIPLSANGAQELDRSRFDAVGLLTVDAMAEGERAKRALANVFVLDAAEEVVE